MLAGASRGFPDFGVTEMADWSIPTRGGGGANPSGVFPPEIGGIMLGTLKHLATFGLSALSLGLALLAVTPESVRPSSTPGFAMAAREWHRPRLWTGEVPFRLPHFDVEIDPDFAHFELACINQAPLYIQ
jgi:hypothetical protein